jgi:hypothetical protein
MKSLSSQPEPQHDQFVDHEERAEDCLIVPRHPVGQVNIEVVCSFIREPGCQVCQRAPSLIEGKHGAFNDDDDG